MDPFSWPSPQVYEADRVGGRGRDTPQGHHFHPEVPGSPRSIYDLEPQGWKLQRGVGGRVPIIVNDKLMELLTSVWGAGP